MDRFQRIYAVHKILRARRTPIHADDLAERLDCGRATVYRILREMEDFLEAPLVRERGGVRYDPDEVQRYELPGLWLNPSEIAALLALEGLLERLEPGFLSRELAPLRERMQRLSERQEMGAGELTRRLRILGMAHRPLGPHFHACAEALTTRKRLHIRYRSRSKDETTEREVSPQRLTHYRDNWYLDAWCHRSEALRIFATDRIEAATLGAEPAEEISDETLDAELATAYGIFAGPAPHTAVLRFSPERARWVADERWHPEQIGRWLADGCYELKIPYGDPRELVGDILRHGAEVEVVGPGVLETAVRRELEAALSLYSSTGVAVG